MDDRFQRTRSMLGCICQGSSRLDDCFVVCLQIELHHPSRQIVVLQLQSNGDSSLIIDGFQQCIFA